MNSLKNINEVTACVVDYGTFVSLADKLGSIFKKVYYYRPHETEYRDIHECVTGKGIKNITCIDEFLSPSIIDKTDLYIFPDIGYAETQLFLRSIGKAVWGSNKVTNIELYRSVFMELVSSLGLPIPKIRVIEGFDKLNKLLEKVVDKWIKVDVFRNNMETWHHIDYEHSLPMLRYLASTFGGVSEEITFIVQDPILDAQEIGYDGFSIDGDFPEYSFQGYEKKNELYLGSLLHFKDLPKNVIKVNEAIAPFLRDNKYRNFFASEIRDKFFIDPTTRMAGQTQEQLIENCTNLAEVIWKGANGILVEPKYDAPYATSATLHYDEVPGEHWKSIRIPSKISKWFKLYHYRQEGEVYHFPPGKNDEIGVVIGLGDTIEESIENLVETLNEVKDEPFHANVKEFADLLQDVNKAEEAGNKFSDEEIPSPEFVIKLLK